MGSFVYALCMVMASVCTVLLFKSYGRSGQRILLWSGLCFVGFTLNNVLLLADSLIGPETDLSLVRVIPAALGISLLVYGLIEETV